MLVFLEGQKQLQVATIYLVEVIQAKRIFLKEVEELKIFFLIKINLLKSQRRLKNKKVEDCLEIKNQRLLKIFSRRKLRNHQFKQPQKWKINKKI